MIILNLSKADDIDHLATATGFDAAGYKVFEDEELPSGPEWKSEATPGSHVQEVPPQQSRVVEAIPARPASVPVQHDSFAAAVPAPPRLEPSFLAPKMNVAAENVGAQRRTPVADFFGSPLKNLMRFSHTDHWSGLDLILRSASSLPGGKPGVSCPRRPAVALAGVTGGVGTSTIAASLARLEARSGRPAILFDVSTDSLLPLFFGGRTSEQAPFATYVFSQDLHRSVIHAYRRGEHDSSESIEAWLAQRLTSLVADDELLVLDGGTVQCSLRHQVLLPPAEIFVLTPDTRCLAALKKCEMQRASHESGTPALFLLNQFDPDDALHAEIRLRIEHHFPNRLIPIVIRRDRHVSAAIAGSATVFDVSPECAGAEDLLALHSWIRSYCYRDAAEHDFRDAASEYRKV